MAKMSIRRKDVLRGLSLILTAILLAALLPALAGPARAAGTGWSVEVDGNEFTVRRTDTSTAQTVSYRTVSLSALAGQHFTEKSDELTFGVGDSSKGVTVTEGTPSADAYKYQTDSSRSYRFEVLDRGGSLLAYANRGVSSSLTQFSAAKVSSSVSNLVTMTSGGNFSSGMSSSKYLDVSGTLPSTETEGVLKGYVLIDDSFDYAQKPITVSTNALIRSTGAERTYLNSLGYKIYATICFTEQERDDGYQYVQIVAGTANASYDGADPN